MQASFSSAFLRGDTETARFIPDFRDPAQRARVITQAAARPLPVAPALLTELRAQNRQLAASAARDANLDALAVQGTVVVVTGQQVGLFLGPLYTFYKAASAIALARVIEAESGARCVPIFWLQTEDHDYEEIRGCHVAVPGAAPLGLSLPADPSPERISIAHRQLGAEVTGLHAALEESLGSLPHAPAVLKLFRRHYRPGQGLAAAFAGALAELFADEGLIFLNPRCPPIAALAAPILERALVLHHEAARALIDRGCALRAAGFKEQVPLRPDATLFFFHGRGSTQGGPDDREGRPRYRLECDGQVFTNPDPHACPSERTLSAAELRSFLASEPLRFSTSALLRPLVQDTLLPTVAYVGGPGEIAYSAQLAPLYSLLQVDQPLVVPRGRFRLITERARTLLQRIGLPASALEAPRTEVIQRALSARKGTATSGELPDPQAVRAQLLADITQRLGELSALHPGLGAAVDRTCASVTRNVDKFITRYERLRIEREQTLSERIVHAQDLLFPTGAPQERVFSIVSFACQYGVTALKHKLAESLDAPRLFAPAVRDLEL